MDGRETRANGAGGSLSGSRFTCPPAVCSRQSWLPSALAEAEAARAIRLDRVEQILRPSQYLLDWPDQLGLGVVPAPEWTLIVSERSGPDQVFDGLNSIPEAGTTAVPAASSGATESPAAPLLPGSAPIRSQEGAERRLPRAAVESVGMRLGQEAAAAKLKSPRIIVAGGYPVTPLLEILNREAMIADSKPGTGLPKREPEGSLRELSPKPRFIPIERPPIDKPSIPAAFKVSPPFATLVHTTGHQTPGVIERLIERSQTAVRLPGLSFRVVEPEEAALAKSAANSSSRAAKAPDSPKHASFEPVEPKAQALDINVVADQVYQKLVRRQTLERERRGLY